VLGVNVIQRTAVCDKIGMCGYRVQEEDEQEVGNSEVSAVCPFAVSLIISVCIAANRRRENTLIEKCALFPTLSAFARCFDEIKQ